MLPTAPELCAPQGLCQLRRSDDLVARTKPGETIDDRSSGGAIAHPPGRAAAVAVEQHPGRIASAACEIVVDSVLDLPRPWRLHYGDILQSPRVAYRLVGAPGAPVVAVLGGISAHRFLVGAEGWWREVVGPGCGVDTNRYRVLGIDYLGGRGLSSTPDGASPFPRSARSIRPRFCGASRATSALKPCMPSSAPPMAVWWR